MVVFFVGAASLGSEIAAARLLAPSFGASTIIWANTIATVLIALSIGYWLGGRFADKNPTLPGLATIVLIASGLLAAVPFFANPFLSFAVDALDSLAAGAFLGSLLSVMVLVALPLILLGAVAPYAIRLAVTHVDEAGRVAGRLYAISTVGSLLGVFLAALLLIPFAGTRRTFLCFALLLAVVGAIAFGRWFVVVIPLVIVGLCFIPTTNIKAVGEGERVLREVETEYQYARVVESDDGERRLELNEGQAVHSLYRPNSVLTDNYWDDFLVLPAAVLGRPPKTLAILGNAAGTVARAYGKFFPQTRVDAVEIDPMLNQIGRRWFGMRAPRLRVHTDDARPFLRKHSRRYEAIFVDAYRQPYVPFYLTTHEFFQLAADRLYPGGVLVVNVGHPEGSLVLERALSATLASVFPFVQRDPAWPTNTLLVAAKRPISAQRLRVAKGLSFSPLRQIALRNAKSLAPKLGGGEVFSDDDAPVEWLVDKSIIEIAASGKTS